MQKNNSSKFYGFLIITLAFIGLPFLLSEYHRDVAITLLINFILVSSFRLITTMGGWSLAHIPLMGLGAYTSAILTRYYGWPFWITLPTGGAVAALISWVMSFPLVRIKGFAFFIASFAAGEAMRLAWTRIRYPFGGHRGIVMIPVPNEIIIPGLFSINFYDSIPYYYLTFLITGVSLIILYRIDESRIGYTLKAIEMEDRIVNSVGIKATQYKMISFVIGAFFAGIAGVVFAHRYQSIDPSAFGFLTTLYLIVWVLFGGTKTFIGPLLGVTVLTIVQILLRNLAEWLPMVYGFILIVTVLFLPEGLEGLPRKVRKLWKLYNPKVK
ncbi:MAG: branched-chain amino acid ABC transporter permease [Desulfobacterales bacterium]|nr:branched-chain amino acid ABC transporter permease [Desulfobacterales bacterium]